VDEDWGEDDDFIAETEICEDAKEYVMKTCQNEDDLLIRVCQLNIRSLRKNFDELVIFLNDLKVKKLHIIILTETWNVELTSYHINGYKMYYSGASHNKNDGVVIYVKEDIHHMVKHSNENQFTFTNLQFTLNSYKFNILSTYRPPSTNVKDFIRSLEKQLENLNHCDFCIFAGDININLLDSENNLTQEYVNILNSNGFLQHTNKPTRITADTKSCIDHFFVKIKSNRKLYSVATFIIETFITDHFPLILNINKQIGNRKNDKMTLPQTYTKVDEVLLKNLLYNQNWENVLNAEDPETGTQVFTDIIKNCCLQSESQCTRVKKVTKLKPWITVGLITSINKRNKLRLRALRYKDDEELVRKFKEYRNLLTKLIKTTKFDYFKRKIAEAGKDTRKIWKVINQATDESTNKANLVDINIEVNSSLITETRDKANAFNEYFINITNELLPNTQNENDFISDVSKSMFLTPVDKKELIEHISSLKINSAPGKDGISARIIKEHHPALLEPIKHIINLIITTSKVPSHFKMAIITPVHKSGDVTKIENYRPISIISNLAKLFEKCIKKRIMNYLENNKILYSKQYGFRQGVSTKEAVFDLINNIYDSLNNKRKTLAVFLDLAKAFDMVPHDKLLIKLEKIGIRGAVLELFRSYLSNRQQHVKIGDLLSKPLVINRGIPQGTVLGPILFLIYINDMSRELQNGSLISYADDTVLVFEGEHWDTTIETTKLGIINIDKWLKNNSLLLNQSKTKYMKFSLSGGQQENLSKLTIQGNSTITIDEVKEIKYLGIQIDSGLKWSAHINHLTKKLKSLIYRFYILRNIMPIDSLKAIYYSLVETHLRYCNIVWGALFDEHLQVLNVVHRFIIKVIFKLPKYYSTENLFKETKTLNIRGLYILDTLLFLYKNNAFAFIDHPHNTRANFTNDLKIQKCNFTGTQRFISFFGPKLFNMLPTDVKALKTKEKFKKVIKTYVLENYDLLERVLHLASYR